MGKKILEAIILVIASIALVMLVAQSDNAWLQLLISAGSASVLALCAYALNKMGLFEEE